MESYKCAHCKEIYGELILDELILDELILDELILDELILDELMKDGEYFFWDKKAKYFICPDCWDKFLHDEQSEKHM